MLYAAAAKVDITPLFVKRTYLAGFMPNRLADGVSEPLTARILYLEDDNGPMVWITADAIGFLLSDTDQIKSKLTGIDPSRVMIAATHAHSTPDTLGIWGPALGEVPYRSGRDPQYIKWMIQEIVHGVERARSRKRPAVIGFGEDTQDKSDWVINIRQPGYLDHTMSVMRVDDVDGRPIACLTNYACHPETLWENNKKISPDFVHYLHKEVEQSTGAVSLYANGALGGMVTPNLDDDAPLRKRRSFVKRLGKALGGFAADSWDQIKPKTSKGIDHQYRRLLVPLLNKQLHFAANLGLFNRHLKQGKVETALHVWRIGQAQLATLPGEPIPAVGFAVKKMMSAEYKFLIGLGDDELGYLLDDKHAADPKYHYERSVSIGPEGLSILMQALREMTAAR